ncbi:MAG: zinc finger MYND domain-containing protein [Chlamydiales bacterium]
MMQPITPSVAQDSVNTPTLYGLRTQESRVAATFQMACWTCGKPISSMMNCCGGCGIARYCCRAHQIKDWADSPSREGQKAARLGHRHFCKQILAGEQESVATVEHVLYTARTAPRNFENSLVQHVLKTMRPLHRQRESTYYIRTATSAVTRIPFRPGQ